MDQAPVRSPEGSGPGERTAVPASFRLIVLVVGQLAMLALMRYLLNSYEPAPNGFRLDNLNDSATFAVVTAIPVLIGAFGRSRLAVLVVAAAQLLSPLILISTMKDPNADLNFAVLLWWFPMPALAAAVVFLDARLRHRR